MQTRIFSVCGTRVTAKKTEPRHIVPKFSKTHAVQHDASDMFELVSDIEKYPEFVPLCQSLSIRSTQQRAGRTVLIADMTVGYLAIRETLGCQVILNKEASKIDVSYIEGPFKYLQNEWRFEQTEKRACDIHFSLDYEFKSRSLALLMGSMFDHAFSRFTKAFEDRANKIYGSVS